MIICCLLLQVTHRAIDQSEGDLVQFKNLLTLLNNALTTTSVGLFALIIFC